MLKSQVLAAVSKAKLAVQDLAITVQHVKRTVKPFIPGSAPTYSESIAPVYMVFTKFNSTEIDNDRVQSTDWRGLVFPRGDLTDFNVSDIIRVGTGFAHIAAGDYRILNDDKITVGDTVALHQLQLRKL